MAKNIIKRLGVCGDSWMSAVKPPRDGHTRHFTQQVAEYFGSEYVTYARGACSNPVIRLQIDACIAAGCDYVIIKDTTPDRGEFPIGGGYRFRDGILNVLYHGDDVSCDNADFSSIGVQRNASLLSNTYNNIVKDDGSIFKAPDGQLMASDYHGFDRLSNGQVNYLHKYILYYHESNWRLQQDTWLLRDGLRALDDANIPYSFISTYTYSTGLFEQSERIVLPNSPLNPAHSDYECPEGDPRGLPKARYHTHVEEQDKLAKAWIDVLRGKGYGKV